MKITIEIDGKEVTMGFKEWEVVYVDLAKIFSAKNLNLPEIPWPVPYQSQPLPMTPWYVDPINPNRIWCETGSSSVKVD